MRYHEWHLDGYSVADGGKSVVLHLLWDYPGQARERSDIRFSDVALYPGAPIAPADILTMDEQKSFPVTAKQHRKECW